jgi:hypothetical protein
MVAMLALVGLLAAVSCEFGPSRPAPAKSQSQSSTQPQTRSAGPGARSFSSVAYDQKRNRLVVFGGAAGQTRFDDTWTWDGSSWTTASVAVRPPARSGAAAAYEPSSGVVIHGGSQAGNPRPAPADTWLWDGKSWRLLAEDGPRSASTIALAYEPNSSSLMAYARGAPPSAGETWRLTGARWQLIDLASPYLNEALLSWDGRRLILVGAPFGPEQGLYRTQTWAWQGGSWARLHPAVDFPINYAFAGAYDPGSNRIIGVAGGAAGSETWTWDGSTWARLHPEHQPALSSGGSAAYSASKRQVLVFGGQDTGGVATDQLWAWSGSDWSRLSGTQPSPMMATAGPSTRPTPVPMRQSEVAAAVRAGTTGIDPRLVPTYVPEGMFASLVATAGGGLSINYSDDTHQRTMLLAVIVANPPPAGSNGRYSTITFRGQSASYSVFDVDNPVAQRNLMWGEPGTYTGSQLTGAQVTRQGVPYFASSSGITEQEFFKILDSLEKV